MQKITSFAEANAALTPYVTPYTGQPYTLDAMSKLMDFFGNPQNKLSVIHVAGTSGKTSTSYYLAALLHATGRKVGLSVSPHIDTLAERTQISMKPLEEADYCNELSTFLSLVAESGIKPSHFELLIAFMYWLFERRGVDYAVVEVGLGGLLDCTNVIDRSDKVCVITDIGFDHVNILGNTLPEIAFQKAGIILPENRVFVNPQPEEVMAVFRETSARQKATLQVVDIPLKIDFTGLPKFQRRNLSLAFYTITHVLPSPEDRSLIEAHLDSIISTYIPARMEAIPWRGTKTLILDGAHNEQKIRALVDSMKEKYGDTPIKIVAAFGESKFVSLAKNLAALNELSNSITFTRFRHGQDEWLASIEPAEMVDQAHKAGFATIQTESNPEVAITRATEGPESIVLVTGSFYLLEQIRPFIFKSEKRAS